MATEFGEGFYTLDPNGETVTLDSASLVTGSSNDDNLTVRNVQGFGTFVMSDGQDTVTLEAFAQSNDLATSVASVSLFGTDTSGDNLGPDDSQDTVTLGSAIFESLPSDSDGRAVIITGFGPEDRLNLNGISASDATVVLNQEIPGFVNPDSLPGDSGVGTLNTGAQILIGDVYVQVYNNIAEGSFADEADFNNRVTFGKGGTASFEEPRDLTSILEDFRANGTLPTESIEGVFELPTGADDDDTIINIPSFTVEIGGETVTFDPDEPFFFDDLPAQAREAILADPELAVGYDYQISNPADGQAFATVMAPSVGGDQSYNLIVFDESGTAQPARTIAADETIDFEADYDFAVTHFIIEGISPDASLNPENSRAFPTSISFTQDGNVDLQQTPLIRGFEFGAEDTEAKEKSLAAVYVGYFGRAADPAGLDYWEGELDAALNGGKSLTQALDDISEAFRQSTEAQELFPFLGEDAGNVETAEIETFVNSVFNNLFNRDASSGGLNYWAGEIQNRVDQGVNLGDIIVDIISGAQTSDAVTVGNKIGVSRYFANTVNGDGWSPDDATDLAQARNAVRDVDDTDASVNAGRGLADDAATDSESSPIVALSPAEDALMA